MRLDEAPLASTALVNPDGTTVLGIEPAVCAKSSRTATSPARALAGIVTLDVAETSLATNVTDPKVGESAAATPDIPGRKLAFAGATAIANDNQNAATRAAIDDLKLDIRSSSP